MNKYLLFIMLLVSCSINEPEVLTNTENCRIFDIEETPTRWSVTVNSQLPTLEMCVTYDIDLQTQVCKEIQLSAYDCMTFSKYENGMKWSIDGCESEWYFQTF